ncbi:hypothetical protein QT987_29125 [Microcoleus sp. SVA1B4]
MPVPQRLNFLGGSRGWASFPPVRSHLTNLPQRDEVIASASSLFNLH